MKTISEELEELGTKPKLTQEAAEAQWQKFVKEYRIVGAKALAVEHLKYYLTISIMIGDAEIFDSGAGPCIKQFVAHPQNGGPKEIVYNAPNSKNMAAGGTDAATISERWCRIAASLSGHNEGQLTMWLTSNDMKLMEAIAQLFINL
jgi:hypothetical protein